MQAETVRLLTTPELRGNICHPGQFVMKCTTLSHIGPSQVYAPNQENAINDEMHDVIAN